MHRASLRPMVLFGDVNVGAVSGLTVAARAQGAPRTGLAGDSRSRVPMPRLETVAEARLAMPIVIPEHGNPNRIRGDLRNRDTFRVGVEGIGPDIAAPAGACLRHGTRVDGATGFRRSVSAGVRRRLSDHGYCRMVGLTVAAPAGARGNVSKVLP
ncbi:hypothetical protein LNKW23_43090 [Paralimibaculum aggregatum]|uniref:Uncharacterized protein n=2 Tax=Paralimibaculum aggregatum TaxID=3036245 RepID=A0ABQ6LSP0_9RHOB|nr:hypothetical protein LNKW23_43090 [Limibaculum sp. NKW23]